MDKRHSYSQEYLVDRYDRRRFCGKSGEFVNQKELSIISYFIEHTFAKNLTILDSPCGTGRVSQFLKLNGANVIGLDYSEPMLKKSLTNTGIPLIRSDMFHIPIKDVSIDCIVSLRFIFHYSNVEPVFHEAKRILRNGGVIIFDTFNWSPKANFLFKDQRVFIHSRSKVRHIMKNTGMHVVGEVHCFLVSPMLYKLLPLCIVKSLNFLEKIAPPWLFVRSFWCVRKSS